MTAAVQTVAQQFAFLKKDNKPCAALIFTAPQGWGKSLRAEELRREFGCARVVDWLPPDPLAHDTLHLTHLHPDRLQQMFGQHRRVLVVAMGWEVQ